MNVSAPSAPATPTLIAPANGSLTSITSTYSWNASAGATLYYLLVQNTAGAPIGEFHSAAELGCGAGTVICSWTPATALAHNTAYSWFVYAMNSVGTSAWSIGNAITTQ